MGNAVRFIKQHKVKFTLIRESKDLCALGQKIDLVAFLEGFEKFIKSRA